MADGATASWLRPNEVAEIWGCNRKTVAIWADKYNVRSKTLPGGERRYDAADVERVRRVLEPEE